LLMIWAISQNKKRLSQIVLLIYGLLMFFLIINWNKMPQKFPIEIMPVVVLIAFRAISRAFQFKKNTNKIEIEINKGEYK